MKRRKIHILYEHGEDPRPYSPSYVRLLRPLTHPNLRKCLEVDWGLQYENQQVDAVIVDRLWRPDISPAIAEGLVADVHSTGARLIYSLDDDLLSLPMEGEDSPFAEERRQVVQFLLHEADGVMVTTPALRERLVDANPNIVVIPTALDERLLVRRMPSPTYSMLGKARKVIGYMGTLTHDDDLVMVVPVLQAVWERHCGNVEFQMTGVVGRPDTLDALHGLPVRWIRPSLEETEYPLFMLWFTGRILWDIAISPLRDTAFNHCKSDIKFLDYCAIAAVGVYSRVPAYDSSVRHLETGWLVENEVDAWVEALEELLFNDSLRVQLARNATRYLYAERILARCAVNWSNAIEDVLETR